MFSSNAGRLFVNCTITFVEEMTVLGDKFDLPSHVASPIVLPQQNNYY